MEYDLWWKTTFDGRQWRKTTSDVRWPLTKENLWWKTTFDGRQPLTEDNLWLKTTFDWRQPLTEDHLWRKTKFDRRQPSTNDDLWRKTTFDGGRPSIVCIVYYMKKMFMSPHLDSQSTSDPKPEILWAVLTQKRISCDGKNVHGITHAHVCSNDDISRQRGINIHSVLCIIHHVSCIMHIKNPPPPKKKL